MKQAHVLFVKLICYLFGHRSGFEGWDIIVDRYLFKTFDPSGIHWLHSHYRPHARWKLLAHYYPERYEKDECICKRCGSLIWEFYPITLGGRVWGPPDEYEQRVGALWFEKEQFNVGEWRV